MTLKRLAGIFALAISSSKILIAGDVPAIPETPRWVWSVLGQELGATGMAILDSDGDGFDEIFVAARTEVGFPGDGFWLQIEGADRLEPIWSSLPSPDPIDYFGSFRIGIQDLIAIVSGGRLRTYEPTDRDLRHDVALADPDAVAFAISDFDLDGEMELVSCDQSNLYVQALETGIVEVTKYGFGCRDIAIGQADEDPQLEIVTAGNPSGGFVLDGLSLAVDWALNEGFGDWVELGDLDGDGAVEIVGNGHETGLQVFTVFGATPLWSADSQGTSTFCLADVEPEPGLEVIFDTWPQGLEIRSAATGEILRTIASTHYWNASLAAGDTDGDGSPEVIWSTGDGIHVAEPPATSAHRSTRRYGMTNGAAIVPAAIGAQDEAIIALDDSGSASPSALLALDLSSGVQVRSTPRSWSEGLPEPHVIASSQLDRDGSTEICVGAHGALACFDAATFERQWTVQAPLGVYDLTVGEIDGSGYPEVLIAGYGPSLRAYEGESGWLKWESEPVESDFLMNTFNSVGVLDLSGDGVAEALGVLRGHYSTMATYRASDGTVDTEPWNVNVLAYTDRPHPTHDGSVLVIVTENGSVRELDPYTQTAGEQLAAFGSQPSAIRLADLDLDGVDDYVVRLAWRVRVADGVTGALEWESPYLGAGSFIEVGDFDGDGIPELIVATSNGIARFDGSIFGIFSDDFESGDLDHWTVGER